MNLTTYLLAGYPGLAVISSEEARAEADIASVCASLKRRLHAWSSTEGLVDVKEGRVTACPDPLDALQLLDGMFANTSPRHVVLLRDLQLHMEQTDPMLVRRMSAEAAMQNVNPSNRTPFKLVHREPSLQFCQDLHTAQHFPSQFPTAIPQCPIHLP